jgi:hypothetical protein
MFIYLEFTYCCKPVLSGFGRAHYQPWSGFPRIHEISSKPRGEPVSLQDFLSAMKLLDEFVPSTDFNFAAGRLIYCEVYNKDETRVKTF